MVATKLGKKVQPFKEHTKSSIGPPLVQGPPTESCLHLSNIVIAGRKVVKLYVEHFNFMGVGLCIRTPYDRHTYDVFCNHSWAQTYKSSSHRPPLLMSRKHQSFTCSTTLQGPYPYQQIKERPQPVASITKKHVVCNI